MWRYGFRPLDQNIRRGTIKKGIFWEEINKDGKNFGKNCLKINKEITEILFRKGYSDDPYEPDYLLHKTRKVDENEREEYAIFSIDQLIKMSIDYQGFIKNKYQVKKDHIKILKISFMKHQDLGLFRCKEVVKNSIQLNYNLTLKRVILKKFIPQIRHKIHSK